MHFAHVSTGEALGADPPRQGRRAGGHLRHRAALFRPERDGDRRFPHLRQALAAAARGGGPAGGRAPRWPTARSTPSRRTTSRATPTTSGCRSPRPRRAAPGWRPCSAVTLAQVHGGDACRCMRAIALLTARPGPPARHRGRAAREGRAGRSLPVPPRARLAGRGRRAARQGAEHAVRRPGAGGPGARHMEGGAAGVRMMTPSCSAASCSATCSARSRSACCSRGRPGSATSAPIGSGNIGATNVLRTGQAAAGRGDAAAGRRQGRGRRCCWRMASGRPAAAGRWPGSARCSGTVPGLARLPRRQGGGDRARRAARRGLAGRRWSPAPIWLAGAGSLRISSVGALARLRGRPGRCAWLSATGRSPRAGARDHRRAGLRPPREPTSAACSPAPSRGSVRRHSTWRSADSASADPARSWREDEMTRPTSAWPAPRASAPSPTAACCAATARRRRRSRPCPSWPAPAAARTPPAVPTRGRARARTRGAGRGSAARLAGARRARTTRRCSRCSRTRRR